MWDSVQMCSEGWHRLSKALDQFDFHNLATRFGLNGGLLGYPRTHPTVASVQI